MTRFIYDQFSKDYLDELLLPYGDVTANQIISSERLEIDLCFSPSVEKLPDELGLLGKLASRLCLFEPYRNPVTPIQIRSCWGKLIAVEGEIIREFKRQKNSCTEADLPYLWILTPTASQTILNGFATKTIEEFQEGVYVCGKLFRMGIVVIHQLPVTPETLLLRLLGRGKVQTNAISEVESLRDDNPLKSIVLEQLYNLQQNLFVQNDVNSEDREVIVRLAPLYQEARAKAIEEGIQQGRQEGESNIVIRLLNRRIGSLSPSLEQQVRQLPLNTLEELGEALLDFQTETDLVNWLENNLN